MATELIAASAAEEAIKSSITTIIVDHPGQDPAMDSSQPPGPALVAAATDADPVIHLVLAWLSARWSENTRAAYARDIGITPQRRPGRAPSWLAWCQQQEVHPVTGVTGLHVARYARQLDNTGLSPASAARKLAAISSWYAWLARRGHITASPAAGIARPRPGPHTPAAPALTRDQALALIHAADTVPGPQRARTAALIAVLLFTGVRLSEVTGADVADLGTSGGRRVLWVTRAGGRRQDLPLPGPAASRIDAYLASRAGEAGDQALFATRTGRRLFAADVRQTLRRLATRAGLPADQARHLGPRTIRQSFTTLYLQAGASAGLHSSTRHAGSCTTQRSEQARDPDPPLWPRGRPHCRARRPQHAPRQTRPRLSPPHLSAISRPTNVAGPRYPPAVPESISDNFYALVESGSFLTWAKLALKLLSTYPQSRSSTAAQQLTSLFAESVHSLMHRTLALHSRGWRDRSVLSCWPWGPTQRSGRLSSRP
jgi:site-specific recombinase XerC